MFAILHVPDGDKVLYMQNSLDLLTMTLTYTDQGKSGGIGARFKILSIFSLGENQCLPQQLARLSPLVTLPASNTCPSNNNACGWSSAVALKIVKIVYFRSKNKYFSYLYWHLKLLLCLEWLQIHVYVKRERKSMLA